MQHLCDERVEHVNYGNLFVLLTLEYNTGVEDELGPLAPGGTGGNRHGNRNLIKPKASPEPDARRHRDRLESIKV